MGNSESRCKSCQSCSFCDRGNGLCICYCRDEVTCSCKCNVGKAHDVLQKLASIAGGAVLVVGGAALAVGSGGAACPILGGMIGGAGLSSTIHGASEYFVDVGVGFVTGAVGSGGAVATEKLAENVATTAAKELSEKAFVKGGTNFAAHLVTDAVELGAGTVVKEKVAKELATTVAKKVTEEAVVKGGTKFAVHMAGGAASSLASTAVKEAGTLPWDEDINNQTQLIDMDTWCITDTYTHIFVTVAAVTESSKLAHQASEKRKLSAAKCEEQLHSLVVAQGVGANAISNCNFHGPVYLTMGNNDCPSTDENTTPVPCKESTMDTKDTLNELILHTAENVSPSSWKDIARKLGLKESEIERIEGENRKIKECCIKALDLWRRKRGKDATVEVLKKALIDAGRKDIVDEFDAANYGGQDVATGDSRQVEEETSIKEAADDRMHSLIMSREATTDQVQDPQATTQPKNATSTLPKQPIEEGSRRCACPNSTTSHQEKRAQKDDPRSLTSTNAEPTSIESQPGRRGTRHNTRNMKRRAELNQTPTQGGRRHQSRPGPNSSAGHETGAPDRYRFPWKKKPRT